MHTVPPTFARPMRGRGFGDTSSPSPVGPMGPTTVTAEVIDAIPDAPRAAPPSTYAVVDFLDGQDGSVIRLAGLTLLRTAFILPGIWIASKATSTPLTWGQLAGFSLASSATITGGMVGWYAIRRRLGPSRTGAVA